MVNNAVPIAPVSGSCVTFFTFLTWIALSDMPSSSLLARPRLLAPTSLKVDLPVSWFTASSTVKIDTKFFA